MSCFLPAECKAFLIRLNILQIPGQWVIMSTSIVYFKASLQSLHYLHNTKMTFISQRDKAMLGSSASQGRMQRWHGMLCTWICISFSQWQSGKGL